MKKKKRKSSWVKTLLEKYQKGQRQVGMLDYSSLGLKCGLEIHQRLNTKRKLFCNCPNEEEGTEVGVIERFQRAVAGESGYVDFATKFESERKKRFIYKIFKENTCLVEIDEEPPHEANREAIEMGAKIAKVFNAEIPNEVQVMRKIVVDGSNPSAFQRTMLIGIDGYLEFGDRKIGIPSIFIEEESASIVEKGDDYTLFSLARQGIPLVEIDTEPSIRSPKEAKEVAERIGLMLRLIGVAKRGIGSIRQDVNVSISEGARVEIKGFQQIEEMDRIIDAEIARQLKLAEISKRLKERGAKVGKEEYIGDIFKNTKSEKIRKGMENGDVIAFPLMGFKGILGEELVKGVRLGTEISDYAKVSGVGGIIHSDENIEGYGISKEEDREIRLRLKAGEEDAYVLIAGEKSMISKAAEFARMRAEIAISQVPKETRYADYKNLVTRFLRPLPGGERMYPETDCMPISSEEFRKIDVEDPREIERKIIEEIGNKSLAEKLLWSRNLDIYREIRGSTKASPSEIAYILTEKYRELERSGVDVNSIGIGVLKKIFNLLGDGKITRNGASRILEFTPKKEEDVELIVKREKIEKMKIEEIRKEVEVLMKEIGDEKKVKEEVMKRHRINADSRDVENAIEEYKEKFK
ncbi:MAG: Glu-tRNA(Gln) amidotransferase subunit GatE [Candidatus Micrarchaeaceae archaeon]